MSLTEKQKHYLYKYNFERNLILIWNPWVWKTHIMKKLFDKLPKNEWLINKYWIDDWNFRELITSGSMILKKPEDYKASVLNYPLEMCIRAKVLFFDDLWASENVSEAQKTKLKFILDVRESKWLITIISSNLNADEFAKLYWERIKSRIFNWKHPKWLDILIIKWEDKRKENISII